VAADILEGLLVKSAGNRAQPPRNQPL